MEKWVGKVALVTGASSGIGKAIVDKLVRHGMKVVACARSEDKLKEHAAELNKCGKGEMLPVKCDVTSEPQILDMFNYIKDTFGVLHVCVNNAAVIRNANLLEGKTEDWRAIIETNMLAPCIVTRESYLLMNSGEGHIININSVAGHQVTAALPVHSATKFAITALTEGLRQELRSRNSKIRTTSVSPGITKTACLDSFDREYVNKIFGGVTLLPENIADAIVFALSAPSHVDVNEILIRPVTNDKH